MKNLMLLISVLALPAFASEYRVIDNECWTCSNGGKYKSSTGFECQPETRSTPVSVDPGLCGITASSNFKEIKMGNALGTTTTTTTTSTTTSPSTSPIGMDFAEQGVKVANPAVDAQIKEVENQIQALQTKLMQLKSMR